MTRDEISENVQRILSDYTETPANEITESMMLKDDLGADSLDLIEICMLCEKFFSTEVSDEAVESVSSVGDIVSIFDASLNDAKQTLRQ